MDLPNGSGVVLAESGSLPYYIVQIVERPSLGPKCQHREPYLLLDWLSCFGNTQTWLSDVVVLENRETLQIASSAWIHGCGRNRADCVFLGGRIDGGGDVL